MVGKFARIDVGDLDFKVSKIIYKVLETST